MNAQNKRFWTEFLELYRSFPALWKLKSEEYQNRRLKSKCYERMVDKLRELDPDANRDTVKRKINTFRSNYRRGLRMMRQSIGSGAPPGERYESTLWYFDLLRFLDGEDNDIELKRSFLHTDSDSMSAVNSSLKRRKIQVKSRNAHVVDDDEEEEIEFDEHEIDEGEREPKVENISIVRTHCYNRKTENDNDDKELNGVTATKFITANPSDHRRCNQSHNEEQLLALESSSVQQQKVQKQKLGQQQDAHMSRELYRKPNDDSVVLASGWATQYAELTNLQKIFARKIISDVLFHGCLEHLDESAVQRIQIELAPPSGLLRDHPEFVDSNETFDDDE